MIVTPHHPGLPLATVAAGAVGDRSRPRRGGVVRLTATRALGDCLIVCLNADVPVRRLRGEGRLVIPEDDMLASWGGRTVLVPFRASHSTSRLVGEFRRAD